MDVAVLFGETKRERICTVVALLCGMFVVLPAISMLTARSSPYDRSSGVITPENPRAGDVVSIHWVGNRTRECFGTVNRSVVDSQGVVYAFEAVSAIYASVENGTKLVREFTLPKQMAAGPATYKATTLFICNPIQRFWPIEIHGPDVHFDVAP